MGSFLRTLLCIPIVNVILFACMPYRSYKEFFLAYIETHGKTLKEVWEKSTEREKELLCLYNIYDGRENTDTASPVDSQGHQEGADISGVSKAD